MDAEEIYNEAFDECHLKINEKSEGIYTYYSVGYFPVCKIVQSLQNRFYIKNIISDDWCGLNFDKEKDAKLECIQICNEFINKLTQK